MSETYNTYTEVGIDNDLAESVWNTIDYVEHSAKPIEMIALCIEPVEDRVRIGFKEYHKGMEDEDPTMMAAMALDPREDSEELENIDPDLKKAMLFMYLYQSAYTRIKRFEMGDH